MHLDNEQLRQVRDNTDLPALFDALGIKKDERQSRGPDWYGLSPFKDERHASFHMNVETGAWYCHATRAKAEPVGHSGGGPLELAQALNPGMSCYDAARWLLEKGLSSLAGEVRDQVRARTAGRSPADAGSTITDRDRSEGRELENKPIRQDLRPVLITDHPEFERRGVGRATLEELGIGFYPSSERSRTPLRERLVFQVRGIQRTAAGVLEPVILTHTGRATTDPQEAADGKWWMYKGFRKRLELYNLDKVLLDETARKQAQVTGHLVITEGCFDVAKMWEAGLKNVVATFGNQVHQEQLPRFELIAEELGIRHFVIFYDRAEHGAPSERQALKTLNSAGFEASAFNWEQRFRKGLRRVPIPGDITDPCEFSAVQLRWLRCKAIL